ncbi:MAG: FAD binding domain-containing protein, partial [Chloroflexi bacterium]|nr:FAD binding domain-containing protein [Chloroflexota bacterium]
MSNAMTDSHILVGEFAYQEASTLAEAIDLVSRGGERTRVMAGGTDLLVQMKMERLAADRVVSLRRIPGLDDISVRGKTLRLGALASIESVWISPVVRANYSALSEACDSFSTKQIQVMGTIGGNLANGSPASDSAPALLAFDASVELEGPSGKRTMRLDQFFLGTGKTALGQGELLTAVELARPAAGTGSAFLKMSRVTADIAKANAAVTIARDGGRIAGCRLAFGSVAPTPMRARRAEAALEGKPFDDRLFVEAARIASEEISPIDDVRSQAWYRREIIRVMAYDGLRRAWERAERSETAEWVAGPGRALQPQSMPALCLDAADKQAVTLAVNGHKHRVWAAPNELLLNVLRDQLELTGTKYGCGIGECSACTVQMDGKPVLACLVLAVSAQGREIRTVEGLQ